MFNPEVINNASIVSEHPELFETNLYEEMNDESEDFHLSACAVTSSSTEHIGNIVYCEDLAFCHKGSTIKDVHSQNGQKRPAIYLGEIDNEPVVVPITVCPYNGPCCVKIEENDQEDIHMKLNSKANILQLQLYRKAVNLRTRKNRTPRVSAELALFIYDMAIDLNCMIERRSDILKTDLVTLRSMFLKEKEAVVQSRRSLSDSIKDESYKKDYAILEAGILDLLVEPEHQIYANHKNKMSLSRMK